MEIMARFDARIGWANLISRRYTLEQVGTALRDVEQGRVIKAVIVPD